MKSNMADRIMRNKDKRIAYNLRLGLRILYIMFMDVKISI